MFLHHTIEEHFADHAQANTAKAKAQEAEQKLDQYSAEARKKYEEAKVQAERDFNSTRKDVNASIDKFDKKVIEDTREAKSWFGSWFGGK
jgi:F0F1-type ATP synthase membrane subunit b/b'